MRKARLFGCLLLLCASANAQPVSVGTSQGDAVTIRETMPLEIALYGIFASAVGVDIETRGGGVGVVRATGIEDQSRAEAVFEYMRAAYYAGRASSAERSREFCQREVRNVSDLVRELDRIEQAHDAELSRLASGIAKLLTAAEYGKLVEAAEHRRATWGYERVDYAATFGRGSTNVAAEVARRCGQSSGGKQ